MKIWFSAILGLTTVLSATAEDGWPGAKRSRALAAESLPAPFENLKAIHSAKRPPQFGDWLASHPELGQSVARYKTLRPIRPTQTLNTIHIMMLGDFTEAQREIVGKTAKYMAAYFDTPVKISVKMPLSVIPAEARRTHPEWGNKQILSTYVLGLLKKNRPKNAVAYLAFTASDLWPGKGWNFVFGQASIRDRVGVWSIHRNGDPSGSDAAYDLCLERTIKTATHETGHILTIQHCIAYECNMNGSNNRQESDRAPLALCPACLSKLCWNTGADPVKRFRRLADFCRDNRLPKQEAFFKKSLQRLAK